MTIVNFAAERDKKYNRSSPETILPSPYRREYRHRGIERAPGRFFGRRAYRRLPRPQERVDAPLQADGRGQRGQILGSLRTRPLAMRVHVGVVRFDRERKAQVGLGVFVPAVHLGRFRQGTELGKRGEHLFRGSFEQAPAAGREHGVTAEQHARAIVGDVAGGVAGDIMLDRKSVV